MYPRTSINHPYPLLGYPSSPMAAMAQVEFYTDPRLFQQRITCYSRDMDSFLEVRGERGGTWRDLWGKPMEHPNKSQESSGGHGQV